MADCCVFKVKNLREAFQTGKFEELETLSFKSGEDSFGDEYSTGTVIVRCKKCGAILVKAFRNSYEAPPFGDTYYTVYYSADGIEDAKTMKYADPFGSLESGRRYIQEISHEFDRNEYYSDAFPMPD